MGVPDQVEVVARGQELVRVGLFQLQKVQVTVNGVEQKARGREVGQGHLRRGGGGEMEQYPPGTRDRTEGAELLF